MVASNKWTKTAISGRYYLISGSEGINETGVCIFTN